MSQMTMAPTESLPEKTAAAWPLRAWFVAEVLFALASSSSVFLTPAATATHFAWPIQPVVTAAVFGAIYLCALLLMAGGFFTRIWEHVRVIVLPSAVFTAAMLLPTYLHLDRFSTGSISFAIWLASYVLPPPVFVACYLWQQRRAQPVGKGITTPLPSVERAVLFANGIALMLLSIAVMAFPAILQAVAPFTFTPLTARAMAGFLTLAALLQVSMACENDWPRCRLATVLLIPLPFAILFQLVRYADQVQWSNAALWIFLLDAAVIALLCAKLWLRPPPPVAYHAGERAR
jgi:hypothetical protein